MKYRKGDKVSFLNDTGGGTVSRVDEKGFIYVITADGFEIPVPEKELVFSGIFSLTERESEPEELRLSKAGTVPKKPKEKTVAVQSLPQGVPADTEINMILGFVPENEGPVFNNTIGCYLINDSPYLVYYMAGKKEGGHLQHIASGMVEGDTKAHLRSFDQTTLSKISDIHVQLLFVTGGRYSRKTPVDLMVSLNLVNFSKESYYRENDYFEEKAVLFDLEGRSREASIIPEEVMEEKLQADRVQKPKQTELVPDTLEVDLHYDGEGLANSQLSPSAILALQLSRFHSAVEEAISKNIRRIVVIHGLGQGTLKMQIRKELQEKYPKFIYQDASFKEYGFGATMVHLITDQRQ